MQIEFVKAPPPVAIGKRPKRPKYYNIAKKLIENPGQWGRLTSDVSSGTAYLIKNGGLKAFQPAGAFEATARATAKKNRVTVYVRYIKDLPQESNTLSLGITSEDQSD